MVEELMSALNEARMLKGLSKAGLAARAGVAPETVRKFLTNADVNPSLSLVLKLVRSLGLELKLGGKTAFSVEAETVRSWLAYLGAPLYTQGVRDGDVPSVETVLVMALKLAPDDATVACSLPVVFWNVRKRLCLPALLRTARSANQYQALGFFLELSGELSGDRRYRRCAELMRKAYRPTGSSSYFFGESSEDERFLADEKSPEAAKAWGLKMNMSFGSFASMFRKFCTEETDATVRAA